MLRVWSHFRMIQGALSIYQSLPGGLQRPQCRALTCTSRVYSPSRPPLRYRPHSLQVVASYKKKAGNEDDKSWGELAEDAASVVKTAATKVGQGIMDVVGGLVSRKEEPVEVQQAKQRDMERRRREEDEADLLYRRGAEVGSSLFGGGLLGRAVGGMMGSALRNVGQQMQEANRQAQGIRVRAEQAIQSDSRVLKQLGGSCACDAPVSQSSMTQIINGRSSKRMSLVIPVIGANGRVAQAQVQFTEGDQKEDLEIAVVMPDRSVVKIEGGSGTNIGGTIDVDWREVN